MCINLKYTKISGKERFIMKFKSRIIASSTAAIMLCIGSAAFAEGKSYNDVANNLRITMQ